MPGSDKPTRRRTKSSLRDWLLFDERQVAWIVIALGGVLFFAMLSSG